MFNYKMDKYTIQKAFETIDLKADLIPFTPTYEHLSKHTISDLKKYALMLGIKFEKSKVKAEMIKKLLEAIEVEVPLLLEISLLLKTFVALRCDIFIA